MRVGQAGGYNAAFVTLQSRGFMPQRAYSAPPLAAAPGTGKGVSVAILGGGIAGLAAAYEMRELGYECRLLEARSIKASTRTWERRDYPHIHRTILGYCRKFGIELQVEINHVPFHTSAE